MPLHVDKSTSELHDDEDKYLLLDGINHVIKIDYPFHATEMNNCKLTNTHNDAMEKQIKHEIEHRYIITKVKTKLIRC